MDTEHEIQPPAEEPAPQPTEAAPAEAPAAGSGEAPAGEIPAAPPLPEAPEAPPPPPEVEAQPTFGQRVGAFFKRLFTWLLGILVVFGAGFLLAYITLYRPLKATWQDALAANQALQAQVADLQAQLDQAQQRYDALQAQKQQGDQTIQKLQAEIARLDAEHALLLADANLADARRAIAQDNLEGAGLYLQAAVKALDNLSAAAPEHQDTVAAILERVQIAQQALPDDPATADVALTIAAENLTKLAEVLQP